MLRLSVVLLAACSAPTPTPWDPHLAELGDSTGPDAGWTLTRTIAVANADGARYAPLEDAIYVVDTGSLRRIGLADLTRSLVALTSGHSVGIDPAGRVYWTEDVAGVVYRYVPPTGKSTWVSGFDGADDDPSGFEFAPLDYSGPLLSPGDGVVADVGFNGLDGVWRFSSATAEGESRLVLDSNVLVYANDVAIGREHLYVVDTGDSAAGAIYALTAQDTLVPVPLSVTLQEPTGAVVDPLSQQLYVVESALQAILRVDPSTGAVGTALSGVPAWNTGVDITPDGAELIVTTASDVRVYTQCDAGALPPEADCDSDGVPDMCAIRTGLAEDCDRNRVPDACETFTDCDHDDRPDTCPQCRPIEVVFVMDTSASMEDEASKLCTNLPLVAAELAEGGVATSTYLYGVSAAPGGVFSCLTNSVIGQLGTDVPGFPPDNNTVLGACPGGNEVASEDWGRAVSVVAGRFWDGGPGGDDVTRIIVPIADEGPWCGDPVSDPGVDRDSIDQAIYVARLNDVRVFPVMGTGASGAVNSMAQALAAGTGGRAFTSGSVDLVDALVQIFEEACALQQDCNANDVLDECELADGTSIDCNCNDVLDQCDLLEGVVCRDADGDDVGDSCDDCTDVDGDGYGDPGFAGSCAVDRCPDVADPGQEDRDEDGIGDACDPCTDGDGDGWGDPGFDASTCALDVCPEVSDPFQLDADHDGVGDACDPCTDTDDDGAGDPMFVGDACDPDNCPAVANADQADGDGDGIGDACDGCTDADGDGFGLSGEACPADGCPAVADPAQADADHDGIGDACDDCTDLDGDGFGHPGWPHTGCAVDNCPGTANVDQADGDDDGVGDACDRCHDPDGDGWGEGDDDDCAADNAPGVANPDQADADGDGVGDAADPCTDPDGDGFGSPVFDGDCADDNCPLVANADQADADADGVGDACDACLDADGDGYGVDGSNASCEGAAADCDDGDATIHPGATEIRGDGIDQDCGNGDAVAEGGDTEPPDDEEPSQCGCQGAGAPAAFWWLGLVVLARRRVRAAATTATGSGPTARG